MKKIVVIMMLITSMVIFAGCGKDNKTSSLQGEQQTSQNVELDMMLAQFRLEKKIRQLETGIVNVSPEDFTRFPGQSQNIPKLSLSYDDFRARSEAWFNYVINKYKGFEPVINRQCVDPRMNAIYDDADKGVANGYQNEDIYIVEYETEEEDVYSYLILVREKDNTWKVIYEGQNYK